MVFRDAGVALRSDHRYGISSAHAIWPSKQDMSLEASDAAMAVTIPELAVAASSPCAARAVALSGAQPWVTRGAGESLLAPGQWSIATAL